MLILLQPLRSRPSASGIAFGTLFHFLWRFQPVKKDLIDNYWLSHRIRTNNPKHPKHPKDTSRHEDIDSSAITRWWVHWW